MKNRVELPLAEPIYSTYHNQGPGSAVIVSNPTIRNWYLNEVMILSCTKKFLSGFTTPQIGVVASYWRDNPWLDKQWYPMRFAKGYINPIIRTLLDSGYYVCFGGIDDYYMKGKSWYKIRHRNHDGMICGYDQNDKTYCIYAYDSDWIYQKFWTPQSCFNKGREAIFKKRIFESICGLKPLPNRVGLRPDTILAKMKEYLDSSFEQYSAPGDDEVYGIAVQDYMAVYIEKLMDGSIPYERMDRRIFRVIWEHKRLMQERLERVEEVLRLPSDSSDAYRAIVSEANLMRMLYASHHMRRRDSLLPTIREKLLAAKKREYNVLMKFVERAEGVIG